MRRLAIAFVAGVLFALGLGVAGMTHPSKVLAFLDVTGAWDPSLAFVMGGGVLVNLVGFALVQRRGAPWLGGGLARPSRAGLDARLLSGAAIFGVGWGLGGFCPGPAIVSVVGGAAPVVAFVVAMLASMAIFDAFASRTAAAEASREAA